MGKPQRASSTILVSGLYIAAMEDSVPLLKIFSYLLYLFLLLVAFRAPIFCGVLYKCRGRNGLKKETGEKGQNELKAPPRQREASKERRTGTTARELWWRMLEIPSSRTPDIRHFTFLILSVLLSLYVAHLPFVFWNFSREFQIDFILPLFYVHLGDSALLWGLMCPGLNWSCPEDGFIFSFFLCAAVTWSSPEWLIQYLLWKSLSCLSLLQCKDKADLQKGPVPYPKPAWVARPCGTPFLAPSCHQSNTQGLEWGIKFCPTKSVARSKAISWCHLEYIGIKGLITCNLCFSPLTCIFLHLLWVGYIDLEDLRERVLLQEWYKCRITWLLPSLWLGILTVSFQEFPSQLFILFLVSKCSEMTTAPQAKSLRWWWGEALPPSLPLFNRKVSGEGSRDSKGHAPSPALTPCWALGPSKRAGPL